MLTAVSFASSVLIIFILCLGWRLYMSWRCFKSLRGRCRLRHGRRYVRRSWWIRRGDRRSEWEEIQIVLWDELCYSHEETCWRCCWIQVSKHLLCFLPWIFQTLHYIWRLITSKNNKHYITFFVFVWHSFVSFVLVYTHVFIEKKLGNFESAR